jgi:hypothetical protein
VNDAHDVPEVERRDLAAPSRVLERTSHELAWELLDPDVRDIVPEDPARTTFLPLARARTSSEITVTSGNSGT